MATVLQPANVVTERQGSDEEFLLVLGQRVRESRRRRSMSRNVLAEVCDVSERYLAQLEQGSGNASVLFMRRIARGLQVSLGGLVSSENSAARAALGRFIDSLPEPLIESALQRLVAEFGDDEHVRRKRIALLGLQGAGKTTLGSALARGMRRPFVEIDLERRCLEQMIASQHEVVMSVGDEVCEPGSSQLLFGNCFTIWIKASPSELIAPWYQCADATLDTSGQTVARSLSALRSLALASD